MIEKQGNETKISTKVLTRTQELAFNTHTHRGGDREEEELTRLKVLKLAKQAITQHSI